MSKISSRASKAPQHIKDEVNEHFDNMRRCRLAMEEGRDLTRILKILNLKAVSPLINVG